jgi:hypothetical protein
MRKDLNKIFKEVLLTLGKNYEELTKELFNEIYIEEKECEENTIGFIELKKSNYHIIINTKWMEKLKKMDGNIYNDFLSFVIAHEVLHIVRADPIHSFLTLQECEEELRSDISSIINGKVVKLLNNACKGPLDIYFFSEKLRIWHKAYTDVLRKLGYDIVKENEKLLEHEKIEDEYLIKEIFKFAILYILFKKAKLVRMTGPNILEEKYSFYGWFNKKRELRKKVREIIEKIADIGNLSLFLLNKFEIKRSNKSSYIGSEVFEESLRELIKNGYVKKDVTTINKSKKVISYRYCITNKGAKYLHEIIYKNPFLKDIYRNASL